MDLFHSFYRNNLDMLHLNLAYTTLIPKKKEQVNQMTLGQQVSSTLHEKSSAKYSLIVFNPLLIN